MTAYFPKLWLWDRNTVIVLFRETLGCDLGILAALKLLVNVSLNKICQKNQENTRRSNILQAQIFQNHLHFIWMVHNVISTVRLQLFCHP